MRQNISRQSSVKKVSTKMSSQSTRSLSKNRSTRTSRGRNKKNRKNQENVEIEQMLNLRNMMMRTRPEVEEEKPTKRLKMYESIRQRNIEVNKVKTKYMRALRMTQEDYMKEFKQKAAQQTEILNSKNSGEGSSASFNLNMHQDFIINKLGLVKKLKGHDLIIKTLLYRLLGIKTNDEEMKRQTTKRISSAHRKSVMDSYKYHHNSSHFEQNHARSHNLSKNQSVIYKRKPGTHSGSRFNYFNQVKNLSNNQDLKSAHLQHNSMDITSNRKSHYFSVTDEQNDISKDEVSPKSLVNSIIDQCYMLDNDDYLSLDQKTTDENQSMFELSQKLAARYLPNFNTVDQQNNELLKIKQK